MEYLDVRNEVENAVLHVRWLRMLSEDSKRGFTESGTKQYAVEPILRALGWDTASPWEFYRERYLRKSDEQGAGVNGDKGRADYALFTDAEPIFILRQSYAKPAKVLIEVKRMELSLEAGLGRNQIAGFVAVGETIDSDGVAVVTNGLQWDFYAVTEPAMLVPEKFTVDLLGSELEDVVDDLLANLARTRWPENKAAIKSLAQAQKHIPSLRNSQSGQSSGVSPIARPDLTES